MPFAELDDLLARFLYHLDLDRVRQPKLYTIIEGVKARSDGSIGNFASLLWELDGASRLTDERVLKLQLNTIGKVNPGAARLTPMQRSQNSGATYAELSGREFSMPHGQSLHPNGTLTELTMDNTATYSAIPRLDDGRKVFVVVAFEGVFSITSENKVFLRVQPVLLRYVLFNRCRWNAAAPTLNPDARSVLQQPARRFRRLDRRIDLVRLAAAIRSAPFLVF